MLNKKDQKIIRQMMRHIRTFPLLDSEIRQFERDLTGMALEAEKRREDFEEILKKEGITEEELEKLSESVDLA